MSNCFMICGKGEFTFLYHLLQRKYSLLFSPFAVFWVSWNQVSMKHIGTKSVSRSFYKSPFTDSIFFDILDYRNCKIPFTQSLKSRNANIYISRNKDDFAICFYRHFSLSECCKFVILQHVKQGVLLYIQNALKVLLYILKFPCHFVVK